MTTHYPAGSYEAKEAVRIIASKAAQTADATRRRKRGEDTATQDALETKAVQIEKTASDRNAEINRNGISAKDYMAIIGQ